MVRYHGIDHVQLAAPKGCEQQARSFFGEVIGWTEIPKPVELRARGGVWFQCGPHQVHIGVQEPFVPATKAHPAFPVQEIGALRAKLAAHHIPVVEDDARAGEGIDRFYVNDPFGNRLEFMEPQNDSDLGRHIGSRIVTAAGIHYELTDDRARIDIRSVQEFLANESYWARGRTVEVTAESVRNSYCVASISENGVLVGFARIVTDWATVYYVCDLFVTRDHRGRGIGKALVRWVTEHPKLKPLAGLLLTDDAHGLYSGFGFVQDAESARRFMRRPRSRD